MKRINLADGLLQSWLRALIVLGAVLVLLGANVSIFHKERIKSTGELVYLDLRPVDPRSLMQGDYMALNFALAAQIARHETLPREGEFATVQVLLNADRVATLAVAPGALANSGTRINMRYRVRKGQVWSGTNAFFFEEGRAQQYEKARYGEFRVDRTSGEAVLVGLVDENRKPL